MPGNVGAHEMIMVVAEGRLLQGAKVKITPGSKTSRSDQRSEKAIAAAQIQCGRLNRHAS
jgi:hypothetical protein